MSLTRLAIIASLIGSVACGDDARRSDTADVDVASETLEGDTADSSEVEVVGTLAVEHVWANADGTAVHVRFDGPVLVAHAHDFALTPPVAIADVSLDGDRATLTLAAALAPTSTYTLAIDHIVAEPWSGPVAARLALNLIWHQHQPSYLDPAKDELQGPWVRKHATKDYFDMAAHIGRHPKVHATVNLTSSLLTQLALYVERLEPYVDVAARTVDEDAFLAAQAGHTDPWIDLLLRDTPNPIDANASDLDRYYAGTWSMRSIAEPLRAFFPEYDALLDRDPATYTKLDLALLKVWFELAWMDPDFLRGAVTVGDDTVDLSDVVDAVDGRFTLAPEYSDTTVAEATRIARLETLANRLVADELVIMRGVVQVHRSLAEEHQLEIVTTPFFHPILPLLVDTDLARAGQPADPLPDPSFSEPGDADAQIALAVAFYRATFGHAPRGMWPSEGAVAEAIVPLLAAHGIAWVATDRDVLARSRPDAGPRAHLAPYRVDGDDVPGDGGDPDDALMIVFRDTELSDRIGFFYQSQTAAENVADFVAQLDAKAAAWGEPERVLSVVLDGENAWEWYVQDHDGKAFLEGLYAALDAAYDDGSVVTVTGSELIDGDNARGVAPHPIASLPEVEPLFAGSWIGGRLDTWIGETEENLAWSYLRIARADLEGARATLEPELGDVRALLEPPADGTIARAWWSAWRSVLSAEGSDWFWWYGDDQTSAGGDDAPFDAIFRAQLVAMYGFLNEALTRSGEPPLVVPAFGPILQPDPVALSGPFQVVPVLDGALVPDESEWVPPGGVFYDDDSGAMHNPYDDIARVYYGYNRLAGGRLFIGIASDDDLTTKVGYHFIITLRSRDEVHEIVVDLADLGAHQAVGPAIVEVAEMLSSFGLTWEDPLSFSVSAYEDDVLVDRAPNLGEQIVFPDPDALVTVVFELDVSGDAIPIDTFVAIADPPPPAGAGVPSIVGNQAALGDWTPNTVALKDDGVAPDAAAGDGRWTFAAPFVPGTGLQYKYTVGHSGEGWSGTEEYPLTNRGFTVPADGTRRVRVRDVFADRPDPSGTRAALTTVEVEP